MSDSRQNEQTSSEKVQAPAPKISDHPRYAAKNKLGREELTNQLGDHSNNGGNGGGKDMESRLSILEEKNRNVETNIADIKTNIRSILLVSVTVFLAIIGSFYSINRDLHSLDMNLLSLNSKVELHAVENKARFTSIDENMKSINENSRVMQSDLKSIHSSIEKLSKDK